MEIFEALVCIVDSLLAGWFISNFCRQGFWKLNVMLFVLLYSGFNILCLFVTEFSAMQTVINIIGLSSFALSCKGVNVFKRFLSAFMFEGTLIVVNTLIVTVFGFIIGEELTDVVNDQGFTRILMLVLSKLFIFMVLSIIKKLIDKEDSFKYQDYFLLILFPIAFFCIFIVMVKISLSYNMSKLYAYFLIAIFAIILTYIGIYYLVYKISEKNKLKFEKEFYQQLLGYEQRHYLEAEENFKQIKKIKHDIKNGLLSVDINLAKGDCDAARGQLAKIVNSVSEIGNVVKTNNKILDFVINTKLYEIKNVSVLVSGEVSDLSYIDDIDLAIVLGNIVDNAVEAVSGMNRAEIEIKFYQKNNYQNIIFKNTIDKSVLKTNPTLKTTKKNAGEHGMGINSIREILARYDGTIDFFENDGFFGVHILLPLNQ